MAGKPKPTELRIFEGNRGHRPIPDVLQPEQVKPRAPTWLDKLAKKEWRRITDALGKVGLVTEIDLGMLEAYCSSYSKWRQAAEKATITLVGMNGGKTVAPNPYINIELKYLREMRAVATEFGMSPSSRVRVGTGAKTEDADPMEALLRQTS